MAQSLSHRFRISYLLYIIALLFSCKTSHTIVYRAYSPAMQELRFINDSICVYSYNDVYSGVLDFVYHDTCAYRFFKGKVVRGIILNKKNGVSEEKTNSQNRDSFLRTNLDFYYEVNPIINMIPPDEYVYEDEEVFPLFGLPGNMGGTFYEQFGTTYDLDNDTIFIMGYCLVWMDRPLKKYSIFITNTRNTPKWIREPNKMENKTFYNWVTKTYEYLNYHTNLEKVSKVKKNDLYNATFSFINDSSIRETLTFLNDTVCIYGSVTRTDTCRYTTSNHLIIIDGGMFNHDKLAYSNGILFLSKVYENSMNTDDDTKMTLMIKPFIKDDLFWKNQDDSINAIMKAYYNVYVPINLP